MQSEPDSLVQKLLYFTKKSFYRESIVRTEAQFVRAVKALEGDPEKTGKNIISIN